MLFELAAIDRGIFEALRLGVVLRGYLPDRTAHATVASFETAKQAIKNSGKEIIDVFGVGNYRDRYALQNNKIIVDRTANKRGNVGGAMLTMYKASSEVDKFDEYQLPKQVSSLEYVVTYVCSSAKYDRILYEVVMDALRDKTSLKGVNEDGTYTENSFFLTQTSETDSSDGDYIERKFGYTVPDVFIGKPVLLTEGVSVVRRIKVDVRGGYRINDSQSSGVIIEEF